MNTYLYIKRHTKTGKLYFGKTIETDPVRYPGSGTHWKPHVKKHGKHLVETLWYCLFTDQEELTKFALMCSEQWDIVKSREWANLIPENGLDGGAPGTKQTPETIAKRVASRLGKPGNTKGKKLGPQSPDHIAKKVSSRKNVKKPGPQSPEHRAKISAAQKGRKRGQQSPEHIAKRAASNRKPRGPYRPRVNKTTEES